MGENYPPFDYNGDEQESSRVGNYIRIFIKNVWNNHIQQHAQQQPKYSYLFQQIIRTTKTQFYHDNSCLKQLPLIIDIPFFISLSLLASIFYQNIDHCFLCQIQSPNIIISIMRGLIKLFTGLGALILLLIGIGLLGVTIYGFINSSIFLGDDNTKNIVLGVMLGVSLAVIGGSAEGIYGICKERPKLICGFQIIVILFMLIFFGAGAGFVILPDAFFNGNCQNSTNSVIQYASNIYDASIKTYCTGCTCALNTTDAFLNATYSPQDILTIKAIYNNTADSGAHSSSACINDASSGLLPAEMALFGTISELEKLLECSDWCEGSDFNLIYRFNDINSGKPANFCYPRLKTFFNDFSYYGKLGFFIGGGVLFVMFACNMYICCSPQRRKKKNLRERFMLVVESGDDDDDGYYRRR